ncbi:MAG: DUF6176 family protein [Rhodospirillaceae bacterium]
MNYSARKIYLTCDERTLQEWASFMRAHMDDVAESLRQERVRHELWFSGKDSGGLFVIGVMDVDDQQDASNIAQDSISEVDLAHKEFKKHWDRTKSTALAISPTRAPTFEGCTLLFEARP